MATATTMTTTIAARATTAAATTTAAMLGTTARILVRLVLTTPGTLRTRGVGTFLDLEFGRFDEVDLPLEQLLDVAQVAELVR